MNRRSTFVTFLASLIPGAGYMYFGMLRFGIETMLIFFIVPKLISLIGFGFISYIFSIPFWLYTFFDTYKVARQYDNGEIIEDKSWLDKDKVYKVSMSNRAVNTVAIVLILIGVLALVNRIFGVYDIFYSLKQYIVPAIFIIIGLYVLFNERLKK